MRLKITKIWEKNNNEGEGSIKLVFEENIKVTKAYYLYTEYILIAELGGYIGLFLGVSINQISDYLDTLCTWIYYRKKYLKNLFFRTIKSYHFLLTHIQSFDK